MSTETLTEITQSIREIRESLREDREALREQREILQENGKWRAEADRQMVEWRAERAEADREFDRKMGRLTSRIGEIVESMFGGNIVSQFRNYGYDVNEVSRNNEFGIKGTAASGEIDVLLHDGDVAILVEVKTTPSTSDILQHVKKLEKYRKWRDSKGEGKKRYIGAIAGATVKDNVVKFAQSKGMYVIVQLGNTVEIVPPPKGFKAKEW